jgi:hypothetical protein
MFHEMCHAYLHLTSGFHSCNLLTSVDEEGICEFFSYLYCCSILNKEDIYSKDAFVYLKNYDRLQLFNKYSIGLHNIFKSLKGRSLKQVIYYLQNQHKLPTNIQGTIRLT